jgi:glycosyltransferase involved in cell wall biosynthesis
VPHVSVVVPTFNNASFVVDTVESILDQTYTDFELVIADHASADGTWELLQRYSGDRRVRLLQTEAGGGAQQNWNRVSQAAEGQWLKLVCGDDLLYPTSLETQIAAAGDASSAGRSVALVAGPREIVDATGRRVLRSLGMAGLRGHVAGSVAIRRAIRHGTNIFGEPCCTLLRTDLLKQVGWWDGRRGYLIDEATYFKVLGHGDLVAVPETLAAFRVSSAQWSVRLTREQARQAIDVHREVSATSAGVVSPTDVLLGNARAHLHAVKRRLAYFWLRSRMRTPTRTDR